MNAFRQWHDAGYRDLIPVVPPDAVVSPTSHVAAGKGKSPGIKLASGLWSGFKGWITHQATEQDLDAWHGMGASVGLRFGDAFFLDIDAYDEATADRIEKAAIETLGPAPCRVGQWPKRALLYRSDGTVKKQRLRFAGPNGTVNMIEIPQQAVVQGIHAKTGRPYEWRRKPITLHELSGVSGDQMVQFMEAMRAILPSASRVEGAGDSDVNQVVLRGHPDIVAEVMTRLPNTKTMRWDEMIKLGYATKAALPDQPDLAFQLWDDWCSRWEDDGYDPEHQSARWQSLKPPARVGADWIYDLGNKHLGEHENFDVRAKLLDGRAIGEKITAEIEDIFAHSKKADGAERKTFKFEPYEDVVNGELTFAPPLIDGLLDQGAMSVVYGDSNAGKTFIVMDMAFHIATGLPYGGMDATQGLVVYVAAEGGDGIKKRVKALNVRYPDKSPQMVLLASPVDLRRVDADLKPLIDGVRGLGVPVALLVIDTLSRVMAGGDENSSVDMGVLVKHFDVLRKAIAPAHLLIVHHSGKDRARGARGHSLLRAATDTEIEVEAGVDGAPGIVRVTKQRDMDGTWSSGFRLIKHELGTRPNGKIVTSCTVNLLDSATTALALARPTDRERDVLNALKLLVDEAGEGEITTDKIAAAVTEDTSKSAQHATRQTLSRLAQKGHVVRTGRGKWGLRNAQNPLCVSGFANITIQQNAQERTETHSGIFD